MITQIHLLEILSSKDKFNHNYGGFYLGHDCDQVIFGFTVVYPVRIDSIDEVSTMSRDENFESFTYYSDNNQSINELTILNNISSTKDYFSPNAHETKLINDSFNNKFYPLRFFDNPNRIHNLFIRSEMIYSNYFAQWLNSDD